MNKLAPLIGGMAGEYRYDSSSSSAQVTFRKQTLLRLPVYHDRAGTGFNFGRMNQAYLIPARRSITATFEHIQNRFPFIIN